ERGDGVRKKRGPAPRLGLEERVVEDLRVRGRDTDVVRHHGAMVWRARARHVTRGRGPATGDRNARAIDPCVDDGDVDAAAGQLGPVQRGDAESPGHVLRGTNG